MTAEHLLTAEDLGLGTLQETLMVENVTPVLETSDLIQNRAAAVLPAYLIARSNRRAQLRGNNERSAKESFGHGRTNRAAKAAASMRTVEHRMAA